MKAVTPVTWLVSIAVVLICTFVTSTLLVERHNGRLDDAVAQIVDNAAPSITQLAGARTEMRHLELGVGRYFRARVAGIPYDREQLGRWRAAIDKHLETYAAQPFFPGERERFGELAQAKQRVYDDVDRIAKLLDDGHVPEARAISLGSLDRDAETLDALTARLITFNNDHAASSARDIAA
jgi:hypothetical protein